MYYPDIGDKLSFLVVLCFAFFILIFTLSLNKSKSVLKLMGLIFICPFVLSTAAYFSTDEAKSVLLLSVSDLYIFTVMFLLLALKSGKYNYNFTLAALLSIPFAILLCVFFIKPVHYELYAKYFMVPLVVSASMSCMYRLQKVRGNRHLIFWASLSITAGYMLKAIPSMYILEYIFIGFKLTAYILLTHYFFNETYTKLMSRVAEAEVKLSDVDRTLNLEVRKRTLEIERSNEKLVSLSKTDPLTKVLNKSAVLDIINGLAAGKNVDRFAVLMFDIDNFKTVNDTLGHIVGDKCIKKLALTAKNCLRDVDSIGRYGGDEFIIVLPGTHLPQARLVAERLRKKAAESESPHFTISIGIAIFPDDASSPKDLISVADEGMYQAKRKGRNAVSYKNVF